MGKGLGMGARERRAPETGAESVLGSPPDCPPPKGRPRGTWEDEEWLVREL